MNTLFVLSLLLCISVALSARCFGSDFRHTCDSSGITCGAGFSIECLEGQCTCSHDAARCTTVDDCGHDRCSVHLAGHVVNSYRGRWHCDNNKCKCTFF